MLEAQKKILAVDDESHMRNLLNIYLKEHGYLVEQAASGEEALQKLDGSSFDLILLDIMMPGMDGWEVCGRIRAISDVPIIMLTARDHTLDKVKGLKLGADDYLSKPFEQIELIARMEAVLRRVKSAKEAETRNFIFHRGLKIDFSAHQVYFNDEEIKLTPKEFELLRVMMENKGHVLSREQLLQLVWGYDFDGDERTVDSHLKNLREKLRKGGQDVNQMIQTVWGVGYKLV